MIHRFIDKPARQPGILSPPYSVLTDFSAGGDGEYNIWLVDDGTPTQITPFATDGNVDSKEMYFPVLSKTKKRIVFRGLRLSDSAEQMLGINWNGGTPNALVVTTVSGSRLMHPMWHPDSNQIVYVRGEDFAFSGQIELTDFAGTSPTVLYTPPTGYGALRPSYNYDGSKIAFWLDKDIGVDASEGLYVMDDDGSNVTQVKSLQGAYQFDGQQYCWANTDNVLAYHTGAAASVYVINSDGTGDTKISVGEITTNSQSCRISKYAWATDDSLVYISSLWFDGSANVWRPYSCVPDGTGVTRLNDSHGPFNQANATNVFYWPVDDRLYFIEVYGTSGDGKFSSMAADGSDYRVEHLLSDDPDLTQFFSGTGIEFV